MKNIIETKSSIISILARSLFGLFGSAANHIIEEMNDERNFRGKSPVGFWDVFTRWRITVDVGRKMITVRKRNWYLIGSQEDTYAFKSVRHVTVHNLVLGADLGIKLLSGYAAAYSIPKGDAKRIKQVLMNPDWNARDNDVSVDFDGHHGL